MVNANRGSSGFQSSEFEQEYDRPSKSQLKRDMTALQKLGEQLVNEPKERVERVPMPDDLRAAILEARRVKVHEGRRRLLQFIGRLMRELGPERVAAIQNAVDGWKGHSKSETCLLYTSDAADE